MAIGAASDPTLQRVVRRHPLTPDDHGVGDATPEPVPAAVFIAEDSNRARMAGALMHHYASGRVPAAWSMSTAGPDSYEPAVIAVMKEIGVDLFAGASSPSTTLEDDLGIADVVVTLGANGSAPPLVAVRHLHWPLQDPARRSIGEVRRIRDDVKARVFELLAEMTPDPSSAVDRRRVRAGGEGRTR